jgi:hypothetical protein
MAGPAPSWSTKDRNRIAEMLRAGWSRRNIAAAFHVSRNAVCGLIFRDKQLRATARPKEKRSPMAKQPPKPKPPPSRTIPPLDVKPARNSGLNFGTHKLPGEAKSKPLPPPSARAALAPDMRRVPLVDLNANECRWPVAEDAEGRHLFCGAGTQPEKSWCPYHCAIGWRAEPFARVPKQ